MSDYAKPLPTLTDENRPFWDACRAGRLCLQRCDNCAHIRYPISPVCPRCLASGFEWAQVSGRGSVFSYIVFHRAYHPGFRDELPYNVALVQLDEGPRMYSNIVGTPNDQVRIGDAVEVVFDRATDEVTIPKFRLRAAD
ncbi:putative nucleic-acid-binding protein containing a Zn-ribbon (plasmid) [Variovorax sp. SRS16]|uniref:Zn-ribbon domain-containing OB-fold protein n=1 Tax=Variovorax sp. SRS16 TaxID=282217 RepID=UPI0013171941|nr:Zn-ribbon domain-containing OB-fold protein [Variovorax sp. SRS16]VTU45663.1 putative nucleic-acid-binding protein containing a Zn-ribbon [Variovorax sp. SRS16]